MRIVLQRVTSACVKVDGNIIGEIGTGFLLLFGVGHEDTEDDCRRLADKISGLRIFSDENDKINLDLDSVGGQLLCRQCSGNYEPLLQRRHILRGYNLQYGLLRKLCRQYHETDRYTSP